MLSDANKMKYKMTEERWKSIKQFLDYAIEKPEKVPDKGVILSLSDKEVSKVFTRRRIELITNIKEKNPESVSELSKTVGRGLSAVERDLRILENFNIVKMEKRGRVMKPEVRCDVLILPLILPKRLEEIVAC